MNKCYLIVTTTFAATLSAENVTQMLPITAKRHGIYVGAEAIHEKSKLYDEIYGLKTGKHMPSLHIGYLYEGKQGVCWKVALKLQNGFAYRQGVHFNVETKYRLFLDRFSIAPMIGLKSEVQTLDGSDDWMAQYLHGFIGFEVVRPLSNQRSVGIEVKGSRSFQHNLIVKRDNNSFSYGLRKFNGIEVEVPYRMMLPQLNNKQLEIRPTYHFAHSRHTVGLQAHLVHWF